MAAEGAAALWARVRARGGDFEAWTGLAEVAAAAPGDHGFAMSVYAGVVDEFPLCFAYWQKLAEAMGAKATAEAKGQEEEGAGVDTPSQIFRIGGSARRCSLYTDHKIRIY